jgi:ferredoxin/flavodoxin---NADP+ reductase
MSQLAETNIIKEVNLYRVEEVRNITEASYILRFNRLGMEFKPGQHLVVGIPELVSGREYSIYSSIDDDYLEILVREVENGELSSRLRRMKAGEELDISGPFGFFMYNIMPPEFKKFVFIASGTGIAPFHSFVKSFPKADYRIIHGIRYADENYGFEDYNPGSYFSCTSGDANGNYHGRLTEYLKIAEFDKDVLFYFCGNNNMILEAMKVLQERGFSHSQMYTEVYF